MNLERLVIEQGMARALTADALAFIADETGHAFPPGSDVMGQFTRPTRKAICEAYRMTGAIEAGEGIGIIPLLYKAAKADGMDPYNNPACISKEYAVEFGHCVAMECMGRGVSWFDNHQSFSMNLPQCENEVLEDPDVVLMLPQSNRIIGS